MEFSVLTTLNTTSSRNDSMAVLIVPFLEDVVFSKTGPQFLENFLKKRQENKDFYAKEGEILLGLPDDKTLPRKVVLWGLGQKKKLNSQKIREQAAQLT